MSSLCRWCIASVYTLLVATLSMNYNKNKYIVPCLCISVFCLFLYTVSFIADSDLDENDEPKIASAMMLCELDVNRIDTIVDSNLRFSDVVASNSDIVISVDTNDTAAMAELYKNNRTSFGGSKSGKLRISGSGLKVGSTYQVTFTTENSETDILLSDLNIELTTLFGISSYSVENNIVEFKVSEHNPTVQVSFGATLTVLQEFQGGQEFSAAVLAKLQCKP